MLLQWCQFGNEVVSLELDELIKNSDKETELSKLQRTLKNQGKKILKHKLKY